MSCTSCGSKTLTREDISGSLICTSCGAVQEFDNYDAQLYGRDGPTGTYVHVGTSGTGSALNYKDKRIYESQKLIDELIFKLDLSGQRSIQIKNMIDKITDGEFGLGDWFPILIGACSYVVMRMDDKSLPIAEVASVLTCDVYELGRMIARVVEFLDLKLPEFDIVGMFERVIRNSRLPGLTRLEGNMLETMRKQGVLLLNCAVKWFLTTGRRPMPVVVAVLVFVAELNGVGVRVEDVAKEVHCTVSTCKKRYKELLEALVKVAQALPWGKDVTVKNVVKSGLFVMSYMEMKSMEKRKEGRQGLDCGGFDLGDLVSECLQKDIECATEGNGVESDAHYFQIEERSILGITEVDHVDKIQLSHECLAMIYTSFANEVDDGKLLEESQEINGSKRREGYELHACREWWCGKSELSKKLLLKKILEKDVGLDTMPPSFVNGCMVNERRRAKINAAKIRIDKIMHPSRADASDSDKVCVSKGVRTGNRKRKLVCEIDWEDFIIETLLLHQVKEEEIETGHYNTLLSLHVFDSGGI
ncbi:Transcription factor TFIIB [Melia azedarach]|uniref:Transcription factor TFIIB n=1 Tax=Melia azedarach TaxID=155640 RepID=A0ACC1YZM4_MELAZ|nr:Transcription factor TFIIB [Melia azedarach]